MRRADRLVTPNALILSGGVSHPYAETSALISDYLRADGGYRTTISSNLDSLEWKSLSGFDLLVLNCVYWTGDYDGGVGLSAVARSGVMRFLAAGGGIVGIHAASICFDDWPEFQKILGAYWVWNKSSHAPYGVFAVDVTNRDHQITHGIEPFETADELYYGLELAGDGQVLMTSCYNGREEPILLTHHYGRSRVVYFALGHDVQSLQSDPVRRVIVHGADWVTGRPR